MRHPTVRLAAAALLGLLAFAHVATADDDSIAKVTPQQLDEMMSAGKAVAVDANRNATREEHGMVPNAILLTDSTKYDPKAELPAAKDKQLVFYCANEMCGAAPHAAEKAKEAGFENVAVMPAGIMGWAAAGKTVKKPAAG